MNLLRNGTFFKLWLGNLLTNLGDIFYEVVVVWYLVVATGSALVAAGIPMGFMVGFNFGSFIIHQKIDRIKTKHLMLGCQGVRILVLGLLLAFYNIVSNHPELLYLFAALFGTLTAWFSIARSKSIAEVVKEENLVSANGLEGVSAGVVRIVSWGLGGYFVTQFTLPVSIVFASLMAILSFSLMASANWTSQLSEPKDTTAGTVGAVSVIRQAPLVKSVVINETLFHFLMGFLWVAFPFKIDALGDGLLYGFQGMAFGIGYLITSLMVAKKRRNDKVKGYYLFGLGCYMVGNVLFTIAPNVLVLLMALLISGLSTSYWMAGRSTIIHTNVNTKEVGKVFALFSLGTGLAQLPGYMIGGIIVDWLGISLLMNVVVMLQFICLLLLTINFYVYKKSFDA